MVTARFGVLVDDDARFVLAAFALEGDESDVVELMRSSDPEEDQRPCLSRSGAGTTYGGVLGWATAPSGLSLRLAADAAVATGLPQTLLLDLDAGDRAAAADTLERVLGPPDA